MKVTKLEENQHPFPDEHVSVKHMGNIYSVQYVSHPSHGGTIKKLNKEEYLNEKTGEVRQFEHIQNRAQDLKSVQKSLRRLREIINTNVTDVERCRWMTLTYAENMTDVQRLRKDFEHFNERLRKIYGHYEYITAAEPQGRGAWHLHVVLVFPNRAPFLSNDTVAQAWKHGFVKVTAIDNVDNVGAYLTAYLGNMELKEYRAAFGSNAPAKDICTAKGYDENGKPVSKRIVKGARVALYPSQFHLFRKSKGIKLPTVERVRAEKADAFFTDITLTYEKTVLLEDVDSGFRSLINTRYYNTKRKPEKGATNDSQRIVGCIPAVVHGEQVKTDHHIRLHGEH